MKVLSIRVSEGLHERLQMTAQLEGIDVMTAARRALEAYAHGPIAKPAQPPSCPSGVSPSADGRR